VGPAGDFDDLPLRVEVDPVIAAVGIGLEEAVEVLEEFPGPSRDRLMVKS
jgi:hypothetical protein